MTHSEYSLEVLNISKDFYLGFRRNSIIKGVLERITQERFRSTELHALSDIHFSVKEGESLGIIGPNGSGKTTLLKLISGILKPTRGEIKVNGEMVVFLQLGLGFQDELSALENIYLYGALLGMPRKEINSCLPKIIAFSELKDFLNMKLKFFSAGMRARLAFSVSIHTRADIMILDEILAVGDIYFQQKCFSRLREFTARGGTLLMVSQSLETIQRFCQRAVLLVQGKQILVDTVEKVVEKYKSIYNNNKKDNEQSLKEVQ